MQLQRMCDARRFLAFVIVALGLFMSVGCRGMARQDVRKYVDRENGHLAESPTVLRLPAVDPYLKELGDLALDGARNHDDGSRLRRVASGVPVGRRIRGRCRGVQRVPRGTATARVRRMACSRILATRRRGSRIKS